MGRPGVFRGNVFLDFIEWAGAGLVAGGIYGYLAAEAYNRWCKPEELRDPVWVGNRDAYRGAAFFGLVAITGHLVRLIAY
jgi:hypothetical protein